MKRSRKTVTVSFCTENTPTRGKPVRTIIVEHPIHGRFKAVGARDKLQAVQAAAKAWKLQWSKIAKECTFTEYGRADMESAPTREEREKDALDRSG